MTTELIAGVVSVCLLGIVGALIFNPGFRSDLSANPGKVSFMGISIEGVVIVLMTGALITALVVVANMLSDIELEKIQSGSIEPSIRLTQLPSEVSGGGTDAELALVAIKRAVEQARQADIPVDTVSLVRELSYSDAESEIIREFPKQHVGPWTLGGKAEAFLLSVPKKISENKAFWCPENVDKYYEVRSRLDDPTMGAAAIIKVTNPITVADNCAERYGYLQVTCAVAAQIFGDAVLRCDKSGQPEWKITNNKKVPIWVTPIPEPGGVRS